MNFLIEGFWKKTLKFTEKLVVVLSIFYFFSWGMSFLVILYAINRTGNFSFLDTLLETTSHIFEVTIVTAIIKFGVENVFRFNSFGGHIVSKPVPPDEGEFVITEEIIPDDAECDDNTYAESEG